MEVQEMELDIQKLRQEAYCFGTDNYGLDMVLDDPDDDNDLFWLDDFEEQTEGAA
jgi:hypothetical protein